MSTSTPSPAPHDGFPASPTTSSDPSTTVTASSVGARSVNSETYRDELKRELATLEHKQAQFPTSYKAERIQRLKERISLMHWSEPMSEAPAVLCGFHGPRFDGAPATGSCVFLPNHEGNHSWQQ